MKEGQQLEAHDSKYCTVPNVSNVHIADLRDDDVGV